MELYLFDFLDNRINCNKLDVRQTKKSFISDTNGIISKSKIDCLSEIKKSMYSLTNDPTIFKNSLIGHAEKRILQSQKKLDESKAGLANIKDACGLPKEMPEGAHDCAIYPAWLIAVKKVRAYELMENAGRMAILPAAPGTPIYDIIEENGKKAVFQDSILGKICYERICGKEIVDMISIDEFNENVFLTRQEAEKKAAEI